MCVPLCLPACEQGIPLFWSATAVLSPCLSWLNKSSRASAGSCCRSLDRLGKTRDKCLSADCFFFFFKSQTHVCLWLFLKNRVGDSTLPSSAFRKNAKAWKTQKNKTHCAASKKAKDVRFRLGGAHLLVCRLGWWWEYYSCHLALIPRQLSKSEAPERQRTAYVRCHPCGCYLLHTYTPFHANGAPSWLWPLSARYCTLPQSKNGSGMIRGAQQWVWGPSLASKFPRSKFNQVIAGCDGQTSPIHLTI